MNGKESWYTSVLFILQQLNINASMSLDEIKSKLIKRSLELWENSYMKMQLLRKGNRELITDLSPFFKKETYLNVFGNRDIRKSFTHFSFRHKTIKLENRTCKNCQSLEIQDEFHF